MYDTEGLVSAVTAALSPDASSGVFTKSLVDGLDGVWAAFFNAPIPPGGTNWNAYTHEQLYQMLWEGADVGDVSAVSAEWGRHGSALTELADALQSQVSVLLASWQGQAGELAADRLTELSDRARDVGARASTVQKAAGDASDALALARNTMPPPPPDPVTLMTSAVGAGPMPPLEAIAVGGARVFTADAVAGASKAEAVRVMQRYEASLQDSGRQVVPSGAPDQKTSPAGVVGGGQFAGGGVTGGVPWSRLVGGAPGGGGAGPVQGVLAAERAALAAAQRAMGAGGLYPPGMLSQAPQDEEEKAHRNQLPSPEHGLFALDQRASAPVIGALTNKERNVDF